MKELEIDLPWFLTDQQEHLVKGDQVFDDGRRVILFTTNDHLEILAKAPQILGDGTFRITPTQWYQVFIISAQVSPGVFVPVCFALLPDKKRESYNLQFSQFIQAILGLGYIPLERLREGLRNLFIFNRGNLAQSLAQCLRGSRGQGNRGRARGRARGRGRGQWTDWCQELRDNSKWKVKPITVLILLIHLNKYLQFCWRRVGASLVPTQSSSSRRLSRS